jgi:hypothetical protein
MHITVKVRILKDYGGTTLVTKWPMWVKMEETETQWPEEFSVKIAFLTCIVGTEIVQLAQAGIQKR